MASPRSACASAAASFTPSPTMATTRPASWRRETSATFPSGRTSATTVSMPTSAATRCAVTAWSPVSRTVRRPSRCRAATASAELGFTVSATVSTPRATPSQPTTTGVPVAHRGDRPAYVGRDVVEEVEVTDRHPVPLDETAGAEPGQGGEVVDHRDAGPRRGHDGARDGVLGGGLDRGREAQELRVVGLDADHRHPAGRDGAGLVEHDRVDGPGRLEHLRATDQDAELGAATGADHQCGRRGQAERAGAGDDEDGDRRREGVRGVAGEQQPAQQGEERDHQHDRDEHRGDAVGEALDRSLGPLRLLDQPGDLREPGVGADAGGSDDEATGGVDRGPDDGVARPDVDRDRLTGEQREVDRRDAVLDDAVGGDLLARADHEPVADREPLDGDESLAVVVEEADLLGAELHQGAQGVAGPLLAAALGVPAGEQERGHDRRGLEVEVALTAHHRDRRPGPGGDGPERDEGVHRARAVAGVDGGGPVELPAGPPHHDAGQQQGPPLPGRRPGWRAPCPRARRARSAPRRRAAGPVVASGSPRGVPRAGRRRTPRGGRPRSGPASRAPRG